MILKVISWINQQTGSWCLLHDTSTHSSRGINRETGTQKERERPGRWQSDLQQWAAEGSINLEETCETWQSRSQTAWAHTQTLTHRCGHSHTHTHMPSTLHISNQTTSELRAVQYVASRSDITPKVKCHLHISTVSIQQLQYQHDMVSAPIHTTLHLVVRATLGEGGWRREEASSEKRDASSCWSPC